jgi:hypothetical protein
MLMCRGRGFNCRGCKDKNSCDQYVEMDCKVEELKVFIVTFNDGGWHTSLPEVVVVAKDKEDAIHVANTMKDGLYGSLYRDWDCWASEFKVDGYEIIARKI